MTTRVLAADLGATSVRVCAIDLERPNEVEVVHRYAHVPVADGRGGLRWDWEPICAEIEHGLALGLEQGPVASIGIDTWAVDYGLLDADGALLSAPHSYRSSRNDGWREVRDQIGAERLYAIAGLQEMAFNTVFQLAVHDRDELDRATTLLMLPELLVHRLTGNAFAERTSAGSTALVDVASGDWSDELIAAIDAPRRLFLPISSAGTPAGTWNGVPVHLVAGHDTASAVAALPRAPQPGAAFLASGTWFLAGAEIEKADTSPAAKNANFTNEPGALNGFRFLKNIPGLWLLEQCREVWGDPPVAELVASGLALEPGVVIDVHDESLVAPQDMDRAIRALAGIEAAADRAVVVRCILDSLIAATVEVLSQVAALRDEPVSELHLLGGGTHIAALPGLLSSALGVPVHVGSSEATAIGNALVQGIALGVYSDLADARRALQG